MLRKREGDWVVLHDQSSIASHWRADPSHGIVYLIFHSSKFQLDGTGAPSHRAHPREYLIGFTDHNSSSFLYLGIAPGMSKINIESFGLLIWSYIKTCKALELTRQRIVWVATLFRVYLDNTLFLPRFPIPVMTRSDLELERAAMASRRWIELSGVFQKQHSNEFSDSESMVLHIRTSRIINEEVALSIISMVPGGRYWWPRVKHFSSEIWAMIQLSIAS